MVPFRLTRARRCERRRARGALFLQGQKGQRPGQKTRALRYVKEQLDAFDWPLPASDPVEPDEIALTSDSASEIALVCGLRYPLERR